MLLFYLVITILRNVGVYSSLQRTSVSEPFGDSDEGQSHRRSSKLKFGDLEAMELDSDYVKGSFWPKPLKVVTEDDYYNVDSENFKFRSSGCNSSILQSAFDRYKNIVFPKTLEPPSTGNFIRSLEVNVETNNLELGLDMDESYELDVKFPKSLLKAKTVWGALRGLETFSQAVYRKDNRYMARKATVKDKPRFKHRGFLIDTSRYFLPVRTIFKFLDAMSYSKFNVLHWHIVDDPAFPFVSREFPQLSKEGSRNSTTHVYTPRDVQDIISYARNRGIRVIPEFDTPGHTGSWRGIPGLLTGCSDSNLGLIDPTNQDNYDFLERFFSEVSEVFPDNYIHLGADEVDFDCWERNEAVTNWMKKHEMKSFRKLEQYYAEKLIRIVDKLGKNYIVWQDILDNNVTLKKDTVVNLWLRPWEKKMAEVTKKGHKAILSSCWYLNYINYGVDWPEYYYCDPENFEGTDEQKKLVMGGTAAMWGEYVDATNILPRTWGRGLAVGERLWSPKSQRKIEDAMQRIWEHRCRYLSRGIPAEPVLKAKFCIEEWEN